ncbi:hypothetical protein PR048_017434 [Dryococelus australis]|uniref:NIF3-like protein 1 n=1 Tax=Dryococelus australis TaxID=614101 RepID=A0ABQ9H9N2_9NEOP|nr:hypothetical protein PR048_017434 [Dryococelus australis]
MVLPTDSKIRSVALCAGSGGSILRGARADLWLTGEMQHHDVLDAMQKGSHVILCNHSDSERGYLQQLAPQLSQLFSAKISFLISAKDSDPLQTV